PGGPAPARPASGCGRTPGTWPGRSGWAGRRCALARPCSSTWHTSIPQHPHRCAHKCNTLPSEIHDRGHRFAVARRTWHPPRTGTIPLIPGPSWMARPAVRNGRWLVAGAGGLVLAGAITYAAMTAGHPVAQRPASKPTPPAVVTVTPADGAARVAP